MNKQAGIASAETLLKVLSVSSIGAVGMISLTDVSLYLFGVPIPVVGMAVAGSFISIAYGDPEKSRKKMYFKAFGNAFIAIVTVAVIPSALGWEWMEPKLEPPLAGAVAIALKWVLPLVPEILKRVFKLKEYNNSNGDRNWGGDQRYIDYERYYETEESEQDEPKSKRAKPRSRQS